MEKDNEKKLLKAGVENSRSRLFEAYREMLTYYFLATVLVISIPSLLLLAIYFRNLNRGEDIIIPFLPCVGLLGSLGAFFSALTRLYKIQDLPSALIDTDFRNLKRGHLFIYCLIRPITGVIGAIVFYFVVAAELLDGEAFANFACSGDVKDCGASVSALFSYSPEDATDYMKCLVWSFIAGFSERLIPDTLGKMESSNRG